MRTTVACTPSVIMHVVHHRVARPEEEEECTTGRMPFASAPSCILPCRLIDY
jgi:hypothetical protein